MDRRVQRTRKLLQDSLIALILERGYEAVSIQDITDHANLGRATFYLHFKDKEELLIHMLMGLFDDLKLRTTDLQPETLLNFDEKLRAAPYQHVLDHRDMYCVLFSGTGLNGVMEKIHDYVAEVAKERLLVIFPEIAKLTDFPIDLWAYYVAGAELGMIQWWMDKDYPYTPEQMGEYFFRLTMPTVMMGLLNGVMPKDIGVDAASITRAI